MAYGSETNGAVRRFRRPRSSVCDVSGAKKTHRDVLDPQISLIKSKWFATTKSGFFYYRQQLSRRAKKQLQIPTNCGIFQCQNRVSIGDLPYPHPDSAP